MPKILFNCSGDMFHDLKLRCSGGAMSNFIREAIAQKLYSGSYYDGRATSGFFCCGIASGSIASGTLLVVQVAG